MEFLYHLPRLQYLEMWFVFLMMWYVDAREATRAAALEERDQPLAN